MTWSHTHGQLRLGNVCIDVQKNVCGASSFRVRLGWRVHILQAMLLPANFPAVVEPITDSAKLGIQNIFAFCYVWSIGGAVQSHSRDAFDALVRNTFQGVAIFPAGAGLVYDYYCDPQRCSPCPSTSMCSVLVPHIVIFRLTLPQHIMHSQHAADISVIWKCPSPHSSWGSVSLALLEDVVVSQT